MVATEALDGDDLAARAAPPRRRLDRRVDSDGPHAGQHTGWAWKRRSAGSSYSARHAAHMAKPAIVVFGRSYGIVVTIV